MARHRFRKTTSLDAPIDEAFAWHERPGALRRLLPPWADVRVERESVGVGDGERAVLHLRKGPMTFRWVAEHYGYERDRQFCDRQIEGPFARWIHRHRFEAEGPDRCAYGDDIEYELPGGAAGSFLAGSIVHADLERTFRYRHAVVEHDLRRHRAAGLAPSRFLVSGSTGLVGSSLVPYLRTAGHEVVRLVRGIASASDEIAWNPDRGIDDPEAVSGFDFVVHLAGAGIADKRWSDARKKEIRDSRVVGTRNLVDALSSAPKKPRAFLCASAIGIYGETGDARVDEASLAGRDFMAATCAEWEAEARRAEDAGIRTASMRLGIVLDPRGGALKQMLPVFRMGLGGRLGNGRMFMSWISIDDVLGAIEHVAARDDIGPIVNLVAPDSVRNADFARVLARVLGRPTGPPAPAFALEAVFGEMAREAVLKSTRVQPSRLIETGYGYVHPHLEEALRHLLGR